VPKVLVTGGAGYVGSHCSKAFAAAGWEVVVLDNLSRGWKEAVRWGPLVEADIADRPAVEAALDEHAPDLVAHFAAFAYVGESVEQPQLYYANNTAGTLKLLEAMRARNLGRLLFSSTCATYGHPLRLPIDEHHPQAPINPYGWSKFIVERMLEDYARAFGFSAIILRYFNAAGADPAGEIGERHEPETHAIPLAIQAGLTGDSAFRVFGTDFDTRDGSAIRDYIHVSDLADAHVLAAQRLMRTDGVEVYNLGTGTGTSVLELAQAVSRATGDRLKIERGPRRPGDPAALVSAADRARQVLGWRPERSSIETIVRTAVDWQRGRSALL
jgi:UDP-arabinose 4-epimerase